MEALTNGAGIDNWLAASKGFRIFSYVPGSNLTVLTEGIKSGAIRQRRETFTRDIVRNRKSALRELAKY
jgi:hypothetical protein